MRNRYFKYALVLFAFMFAISVIHWIGIDGIHRPGVLEAKITDETPVFNEETNIFDKANPHIQAAMDIQNRHTHRLMDKPEVVGTATGLTEDNRPAIIVFTKKMVEAGVIPEDLEGIPVVVKVTGEIFAMKASPSGKSVKIDPTGRFESPVPIGVSTGNENECSAGTIGARVKDGSGNVYALSNNHVYALENTAPRYLQNRILQPGLYDTNCSFDSNNVIGTLSNYVPIKFNNTTTCPGISATCNKVDAAIAIVNNDLSLRTLGNSTPSNGYGTPKSSTVSASVGQAVQKYGRTTSLTKGIITGINATVVVNYGFSGYAKFVNQIVVSSIKPFIKAGDSGSLVVTDPDRNPVGLLFAGNSSGTFAVANPIKEVLGSFFVTIDGK